VDRHEAYFAGNAVDQLRVRSATQGPWESWSEFPVRNGQVVLLSSERFVSCPRSSAGPAAITASCALATSVGPWEKFQIINNADGTYSLRGRSMVQCRSRFLTWNPSPMTPASGYARLMGGDTQEVVVRAAVVGDIDGLVASGVGLFAEDGCGS
jgi:hypothetical protein